MHSARQNLYVINLNAEEMLPFCSLKRHALAQHTLLHYHFPPYNHKQRYFKRVNEIDTWQTQSSKPYKTNGIVIDPFM